MNRAELKFSLGATFGGPTFWPGLILIAASLFGFFSSDHYTTRILFALIIPFGVILVLSFKVLVISIEPPSIRTGYNLLLFNWTAKTIDVSQFNTVELRLYSDIETFQKIPQSTTVRTKVYEVYLKSETSRELVFESTNYSKALDFFKTASTQLNLEPINAYQIWRSSISKKRMTNEARK